MVHQKGVLHYDYYVGRERSIALKYRLFRRTNEVLKGIKKTKGLKIDSLLDIGTADARMLGMLNDKLRIQNSVGLDFSEDLLRTNLKKNLNLIQADADKLPFKNNSFDVIVATAVIEHVSNPEKMLSECRRVLKKEGIIIITTPDPFFENIATKIGHLKDYQHQKTFSLNDLKQLVENEGLIVIEAEKFMMSPIGFPFEDIIESLIKMLGLNRLLLNQLVIGKKDIYVDNFL